jgi:hypothetical protein
MDIRELFRGIAIIVDNEIKNEKSSIYKIKKMLEGKNIPVVEYEEIPDKEIIPSLLNCSFIILDWDYLNDETDSKGIQPSALVESQQKELIEFLQCLLTNIFIPIFIFTFKDPNMIISELFNSGIWVKDKPNRIFIKQKNDLSSESDLFSAIENWVKEMPSIYALKEWEKSVLQVKNEMFLEMYNYSPNWSNILWKLFKNDSKDNHFEFGEFISRNIMNRINSFAFNEDILDTEINPLPNEVSKVIEGERFLTYKDPHPNQAYTGDLFFNGTKYYLNIRAQCDLARESDPKLYLLEGKELDSSEIVINNISLTDAGELFIDSDNLYKLIDLIDLCKDELERKKFNDLIIRHKNKVFFNMGEIIGKRNEVIITCVHGKKAIKFRLDIIQKQFNQIKTNRIGRIMPPYITRIQQFCSQHIVREGVMPTPKELFDF